MTSACRSRCQLIAAGIFIGLYLKKNHSGNSTMLAFIINAMHLHVSAIRRQVIIMIIIITTVGGLVCNGD